MNTKEKAIELVNKFKDNVCGECPEKILENAKKSSIIAVNEILKNFEGLHKPEYCAFDAIGERKFTFDSEYPEYMTGFDMVAYWENVIVQIELLH